VLRFTETGAADTTFSNPVFHYIGAGGSGIEAIPDAVALQSNGDIVVAGDQVMFAQSGTTILSGLARRTPAGEVDPTFGSGGTVTNNDPFGSGVVAIQSDGKIVVAGVANNNTELFLTRYLGQ
jgi:uncharacterized delta-60 repeat protein